MMQSSRIGDMDVKLDPTGILKQDGWSRMQVVESLGFLPSMVSIWQEGIPWGVHINKVYVHGGGWMPFGEWTLDEDGTMTYVDKDEENPDPPYTPLVKYEMYGHTIYQYNHGWVCCKFPDGHHETSRMD